MHDGDYNPVTVELVRIIKDVWSGINRHRILDLAAQLTYYSLFALFPFALFLITIGLLLLPADMLKMAFALVSHVLPTEVTQEIYPQLLRMLTTASRGFAVLGGALTMWSASRAAAALMLALNDIHGVTDTRPWWKQQLLAIAVTIGVSVLLLAAVVLLVIGPETGLWIASRLHLGTVFGDLSGWTVGWLGRPGHVDLGMSVQPPARAPAQAAPVQRGGDHRRGRLIGVSQLFNVYAANFGSYDKMYGTLGAVILFLTWLWLSNLCLLIGGEIDQAIGAARERNHHAKEMENVMDDKLATRNGTALAEAKNAPKIGALARTIGDDLSNLAKDHVELAMLEAHQRFKTAVADATAIVLGGFISLIGLGMLCAAAVAALEPILPMLWLRLLIMAVVYVASGGTLTYLFVQRLRRDVPPKPAGVEAKRTVHAISDRVQHV